MRIGIFVGGAGRRMGGLSKGLLIGPTGETLFARAMRVAQSVGEVVVVGDASAYGVAGIADDPPGIGPIGGLRALLAGGSAIALACDMPYVEAEHLHALRAHAASAAIVAARREGRWEPFLARYDASVLPAITPYVRSFQQLFAVVAPAEIAIDAHALDDWDTPADIR
jgi:molybdopterin-guanine dinucleotide biosynthesis protein A